MRFVLLSLFVLFWLCACNSAPPQPSSFDWKSDWAVENGFSIHPDSAGYHFPTSIAFVPNPGKDPKDPLYFVTEIAGNIKVVTNDKSVYIFAAGFSQLKRETELPELSAELGTAGICLDPKQGYVFVTFITQDDDRIFRNRIIRFETHAQTFSINPTGSVAFSDPFLADRLGRTGHQIGPCQIQDDLLYVGIGDGDKPVVSQHAGTLTGKIVRMTLDGLPVNGNPYRQDDDPKKPINYIWVSGLRNPFGIKFVDGRLFVADNGFAIDRFLEAQKGGNYLWDGSDWSIGTNANFVFSPSIGPVQLDYVPDGFAGFPKDYAGTFFVSASAHLSRKKTGIITLPFDFAQNKMSRTPSYLLQYRGDSVQVIAGLAVGPDGLYFAPVLPDKSGITQIFRISYDPAHPHPFTLENDLDISQVMDYKGCFSCHILKGSTGTQGPQIDSKVLVPRLEARLSSDAYLQSVAALDLLDEEPFKSHRAARQEVLAAKGTDQVRLWVKYFLQEPRFDNPNSRMPNLGLTEPQATRIAEYILKDNADNPVISFWYQLVPILQDHLILYALASFVAGGVLVELALRLLRRTRRGR